VALAAPQIVVLMRACRACSLSVGILLDMQFKQCGLRDIQVQALTVF
jgi:hypothetical protein